MSQKTAEQPSGYRQFAKHPSVQIFLLYILLPLLILAVLLMPPVSLVDRLLGWNYQSVTTAGGTLAAPDGMALQIPPASLDDTAWFKIEAEAASAGAPAPLPAAVTAASPVYKIQQRGAAPKAVNLTIPLSTETSPPVDLYAWDGQAWRWQPSQVTSDQTVAANLEFMPQAVVLAAPAATDLEIAANHLSTGTSAAEVAALLSVFTPGGLYVDDTGAVTGRVTSVPPEVTAANLPVLPVVQGAPSERGTDSPIDSLLLEAGRQQEHIEALVTEAEAYQGLELDYRAIDPDLRTAYTAFVASLRQALPADKLLVVRVDLPRQLSTSRWETGAYDWPALGQIADVIKIPVSPNPQTYAGGAALEAMVAWATSQIERSKIQLLLRTHSAVLVDGELQDLSDEESLAQIGQIAIVGAPQVFGPGQSIDFTLASLLASTGIRVDDETGAYWFAYLDEDNQHHTVFLGSAAAVEPALNLVRQHHLRGIALQHLPDSSSETLAWQKLDSVLNQTRAPAENEYSIAWRVQSADGRLVEETVADLRSGRYSWQAPESGGSFEVAASILSGQDSRELPQGKVLVQVATPTPTPSPTRTPTATRRPTRTPSPTPTATATPTAAAVAQSQPSQPAPPPAAPPPAAPPPAVKAVNVPFGYGIQADPRGDTAANVGHMQRLGFNWVKFQMAWKDVESAPGDFSWGMWDQLINAYSANGIRILLSIPKAPDWARPVDDDKSVEGPPQDPNLYAEFVAKVADRYRGRVQMIEIWNEQNLWYEAGGVGRINAANYVQLLQLSYRAIKAVNPDMIVVSGAMTPAGNVGEFAVDDIEYLQQMYANGAKGFFDALGAHPSGYNCPASADWRTVQDPTAMSFRGTFENRHHSWCFRGTMEGYREVMVANGDGGKAIVPTEFGWAVSGNPHQGYEYARDNTPEEQAQWIVEAYQLAKQWGWVGPMFLWNLDYGVTARGTELAAFGILGTPAFEALAGMPK